jgi:hypothetical protein
MTEQEWNELNALRNAINDNPASVHPEKMELFTSLFVKSLSYVDNVPPFEVAQSIDKITTTK